MNKPRPDGFDYAIPDDESLRCLVCNSDGMNRTGWKPISYSGSLTTFAYAINCPAGCLYGLKK